MSLGEILRNLLEERDMTQKQFANILNVSASAFGNYVQDTREPDYDTLKRLASYFNVSIDYLLDYRTPKANTFLEDELLRVFRSLTPEQQELFIEQGKLFISHNHKKIKSSDSMIS
jgi:transcriptional regulator with XRE-family HTH domain